MTPKKRTFKRRVAHSIRRTGKKIASVQVEDEHLMLLCIIILLIILIGASGPAILQAAINSIK